MRNAVTVKIDRNKKFAVITIARQRQIEKVKYGSQSVLPVFALPENDKGGKYAAMRSQLQKQISAETGFLFEEVRQQAEGAQQILPAALAEAGRILTDFSGAESHDFRR